MIHFTPLDSNWAASAFMVSNDALNSKFEREHIYKTSADYKFTSTRVGGGFPINPHYQYTRYADTRTKGTLMGRNNVTINGAMGNYGMGDYYSEAIDDTSQLIYMRFGVPQYTSLLTFLRGSYDLDMGTLVTTGKTRSIFYKFVEAVFTLVPMSAAPLATTLILFSRGMSAIFTKPSSKYWTLKPTMHLYWSAVNSLLNTMAVNRGIMPRAFMPETKNDPESKKESIDRDTLDRLHRLMPDIFTKSYGIDVFAIANKAQRAANMKFQQEYDRLEKGTADDMESYINRIGTSEVAGDPPGSNTLYDFIKAHVQGTYWMFDSPPQATEEAQSFSGHVATDPNIDPATGEPYERPPEKPSIISYLDAEYASGSQFACFRVEHTGSVNESFSNETGDSAFASKINSAVSGVREIKFGLADGNIIGGNVLGDAINTVGSFIKNTAESALSGVTLGFSNVISQLFSGSFMDINKTWKSSTANFPKSTYGFDLVSPYNNPISQLITIDLPIAMLMAAALPRSTGKRSYNSPFYCMLFDRGRNRITEGMIDSLTITRGTTNLAFSKTGKALGVRVEFSVVDLSSIMHVPISSGGLFGGSVALDEDNALYNYLGVLTGQDLESLMFPVAKAKLNLAKRLNHIQSITSPGRVASFIHHETTTGFFGTMATLGMGKVTTLINGAPAIIQRE